MNFTVDNNLQSESSDEEFININDLLKSQLKNIYQIQLDNDKLMIKHIGKGSHVPDIIIKESFGKKNNLNLYSCVYLEDEIDFLKTEPDNNKFIPVIKLIEKINDKTNIYSLSVVINNFNNFNENIENFNVFLTYNLNTDYIQHIEIEKNINHTNIIETLLEKIIDIGANIL